MGHKLSPFSYPWYCNHNKSRNKRIKAIKPIEASCGSWASPITSHSITTATTRLGEPLIDGDTIHWLEGRPTEAGRRVIVKRDADGRLHDVTPAPYNVRTRVHEYGGAPYTVDHDVVYFTHFDDQRLYRMDSGREPTPITPEMPDGELRYADLVADRQRHRLICVREDHRGDAAEPGNTLVAIDPAGPNPDGGQVLASGHDFYSTPRINPAGTLIAWLSWDHPNMPWDSTELWVGHFDADGMITKTTRIAGGPDESIFQPEWSPEGILHFVSDRSGWWNLYRWITQDPEPVFTGAGNAEAVAPMEAEFGLPQWVFGMSTYGFMPDGTLVCCYSQRGTWHLARITPTSGRLYTLDVPFTDIDGLRVGDGFAVCVASSPREAPIIARIDLDAETTEPLRTSLAIDTDPAWFSIPESIEFPCRDGAQAYGFFYAPTNVDYRCPDGENPPLIVLSHGGPTAQTGSSLKLPLQYWTSRGFAVLDVNYGGSTGYGRKYRERLAGQWGVVDVHDCVDGALHLAHQGRVDGQRLTIRGWSASGYTTLAALAFTDTFKAGASHYGVSDLEALAKDTHKFESRYLDRLVGPYPDCKARYVERSPIHAVERLNAPLILFQGLEDRVVPPNQAKLMYAAAKEKGLPVALVEFAGEQHGFKRAENIRRALDGELYFLGRILGFQPAGDIAPVQIDNL